MPFNIGDRVRVKVDATCDSLYTDEPHAGVRRGKCATVRAIPPDYYGNLIAIEFDEEFFNGHSCRGRATDGYGWDVDGSALELVSDISAIEVSGEDYFWE